MRFAVEQPLIVNTKLECVIAVRDRKIIGERRFDVIVSDLAPAIEPVDVRDAVRWATNAAPVRNSGNRAEVIVLREQLRRGVVQSTSLHALDFAVAGNEALRVVAHAEVEFIDDICDDDSYPVGGPAVVFVEVV